jgi:hypothetical protein
MWQGTGSCFAVVEGPEYPWVFNVGYEPHPFDLFYNRGWWRQLPGWMWYLRGDVRLFGE